MNYEPYCGYWFYGGTTSAETAAFSSSWGLMASAPEYTPPTSDLSYMVNVMLGIMKGIMVKIMKAV